MRSRPAAVLLAVTLLATAACSRAESAATDETVATTVATTAAPTTARPTTTSSTSTTSTSTTSSTTTSTTIPVLPEPSDPPPPRAQEPVVELGTIEIPKIGVAKTLFEGITLNTLDRGPGHWPGTALPGGYGNVVVGGHRTSKDRPFRHIDQLVPGDEIIYNTPQGRFVYRVTDTIVVTPDQLWVVDQRPGYTTTLFACHPVGSTRERIIVFAELAGA